MKSKKNEVVIILLQTYVYVLQDKYHLVKLYMV